jgi:predicted permease
VRSLAFSSHLGTGFDHDRNLLLLDMAPSLASYSEPRTVPLMQQISERVAAVPGVKRVSFARRALLSGSGGGASVKVSVPGAALAPEMQNVQIKFNAVSPGYFQTVGTRILQGRDFTQSDAKGLPTVVLISEAMARRYWPDSPALGRHLLVEGKDAEVVGVAENAAVNDVHENDVHEGARPYIYVPFAQFPVGEVTMMVEITGSPGSTLPALRHAVSSVDANLPILQALTLNDLIHSALWQERIAAGLVSALCGVGVFLAMVGLYGVIAYFVHRRTHEIGIRMALGAQPSHVRRLVLARGGWLALSGTVAGIIAALALTRLMASYLYGVKAADPLSFAAAAALAISVALAACFFPAHRACKVDPMIALRNQ